MRKELILDFIESWENRDGNVNSTSDILDWIKEINNNTLVKIEECSILQSDFWFYDDYRGEILNRKRSFFSVVGMRYFEGNEFIGEQPIIIQPEIGYLGMICKKIDGVINFLVQAKIEPGNVNGVQLSPTIQATKSNFLRAHGGKTPLYFDLFENCSKYHVIYDQVQSEHSSCFYKKRNRNMIVLLDEDIDINPNYKWMTLGQIKELLKIDNLVNMNTRTVLSGLPIPGFEFDEDELQNRLIFINKDPQSYLSPAFHQLNNFKMFKNIRATKIPLYQLVDWRIDEYGITCKKQADFMIRYYNVQIDGREVQKWSQPLIKPVGSSTLGLITSINNSRREYLIKIQPEIGSFDKAEFGPTIRWEPTHHLYDYDKIEMLFRNNLEEKKGVIADVILSEEGGRFFHEQNRNVILQVNRDEIGYIPDSYLWIDDAALNCMVQFNNCLNIQLRDLLALIDY